MTAPMGALRRARHLQHFIYRRTPDVHRCFQLVVFRKILEV
jgi:hypothetical protein